MLFDKNQTAFPSPVHKRIWYFGTHLLPLEVTLPDEIRAAIGEELSESCAQMRRFFDCMFAEMYMTADRYNPWPQYIFRLFIDLALIGEAGEDCLLVPRAAYDALIKKTARSKPFKDDKKLGLDLTKRLLALELVGLKIQMQGDFAKLSNLSYPKMFEAMKIMSEVTAKEKVSMANSFTYCDFRRLVKGYKYDKNENALVFLSDRDKATVKELDTIAKSHGLKPYITKGHCPGYGFQYKLGTTTLMSMSLLGNEVRLCLSTPFDIDNPSTIEPFLNAVAERGDDIKLFLTKYVHRCRVCNPNCWFFTSGINRIPLYGKNNRLCHLWGKILDLIVEAEPSHIPLIKQYMECMIEFIGASKQ